MKNTTYGDEINQTQVNTSALELLTSEDKVSANSINRPLQNIFEDEEASYLLLQNLIKNIYGNKDGSLPNILEEFKEPRLIIDQNNTFIRIPFGVLNIKQKIDKDNGMSYGLAYSGEEDPDSIAKKITNHKFINDGYDSYTIINKPKLGLAKRQMADFINLDINDLDNDIQIYSKTFNSADEVSKLSKVGEDYYTPIFKVDEGTAKLKQATLSELKFPFTSYYFSVVQNSTRATNNSVYVPGTEQINFPNKEEATSWYFANISGDATAAETINIRFTENGESRSLLLPDVEVSMNGTTTIEEQYSNIVSDINLSYSDYYSAEITSIEYSGKVYSAVKIVSNINYNSFTNNTKMVVYASGSTQPGTPENQWVEDDGWYFGKNTSTFIMKTNTAEEQEYYYDSLSVLYGLFSKYSSYVINEDVSKNEFALEELININDIANGELIVYLNTDFNDKYLSSNGSRKEKYLSASKMFGCDTISNFVDIINAATIEREKPIALFKITISNKQITDIVNGKLNVTRSGSDYVVSQDPLEVIEVLDPGKLSLRSIDVNKLFSDTNTELRNQFVYSDKGFAEENEEGEIEETRKISSKVSRERNSFTTVSSDEISEGVDDLMEFMSPTMLHHTTEDTVKKYISDKYGEKTEIIAGKKYRLKQGETIFDIIDNSVNLTRKNTFNKILLNNSTSTILSRNSGLNINTSNYETESNFKLFADTNKAWINGEDGEITIGVSKDGTDDYDISINDSIDGKLTEVLMNVVVGKYNESTEDETAVGMRDTTLNGSLFVKRRFTLKDKYNNKESSFDINNDEITAANYNDVELTGTSGDNKINLKFVNIDGIYFERKSKDVSINRLTLKNDKSSIAYKTHEFTISDNKALLLIDNSNKITLSSVDEKLTAQVKNAQFITDIFTIGDTNSTGDLKVKGNTVIGKEVDATVLQNTKLNVIGKTIIGGDLTISGATNITGGLTIDGDVNFSDLDVSGNTNLGNGLEVGGKTSIGKNLSVENGAEIIGSLTVTGTFLEDPDDEESTQYCVLLDNGLEVKEKATLNNTLTVVGATDINGTLAVDNTATLKKGLEVKEKAILNNTLTVTGATDINDGLIVAYGGAILNDGLEVIEKATLNNKLTVTGTTEINDGLTVTSGGAEFKDKLTVHGTTTVGDGNNLIIGSSFSNSKTEINGGDISCISITTTSARAKKKNIVHSERNAVEEINKIDIVDFFYKEDINSLDQKVGFIADDTDAIFSTRFQNKMDISNCVGMLLKAVQELSAEIKKLKS